jgi:hypothetical protein
MKKMFLMAILSGLCFANTFNVSNVSEFRQALEDASANGENDTIILNKGIYKTTSDGLGTFSFNDDEEYNLTIKAKDGLNYNDVILDGDDTDRVFSFKNEENTNLLFENISVINGDNGGVFTNNRIEILDCNFSNNNGRGFSAFYGASIVNSIISNNRVSGKGGGFFLSGKGKTTIKNSQIINNSATESGGGFYLSDGNISIDKSIISNNKSLKEGGGFYSFGYTTDYIYITNSQIINNSATESGGGFYLLYINGNINRSIISNNESVRGDGGGFYSTSGKYMVNGIDIINSEISNNNAFKNGGGFYADSGVSINSTTISKNHSSFGGGFYVNFNMLVVNSSKFIDNSAYRKGGGFYYSRVGSIVTNSLFLNNYSNEEGAIYYSDFYTT